MASRYKPFIPQISQVKQSHASCSFVLLEKPVEYTLLVPSVVSFHFKYETLTIWPVTPK